MKPIAIIAIIAAIVVVGGACAGVAFSGVLNGGTTGPGGGDVTGPTGPTGPIDPPLPPTDTPMSTFSPMTSSSSGSSSSSNSGSSDSDTSVECEHAETELKSNDNGTHSEICKACGETLTTVDCTYSYEPTGETAPYTHTKTCGVCNYVATEECTETELQSNNDGTHSDVCKKCGVQVTRVDCAYAHYQYIGEIDGKKTHSMLCDVCGYPATGECAAEEGTKPTYDGVDTHSLKCKDCKNPIGNSGKCFEEDDTTGWTPNDDGTSSHKRTCDHCGHIYTERCTLENSGTFAEVSGENYHTANGACTLCDAKYEGEKIPCGNFVYTYNAGAKTHLKECGSCYKDIETAESCSISTSNTTLNNEKHTYTEKCAYCTYIFSEERVCDFGEPVYNLAGENPTKSSVCKDCDYVKTENVVAAIDNVGYVTFDEAIGAAEAGKEVKILRDVTSDTVISKNIIINPNGKNVTLTYDNLEIIQVYPELGSESQIKVGDMTVTFLGDVDDATGYLIYDYTMSAGETSMNIYTADGLFAFAEMMTDGQFKEAWTIKLMDDIDLEGEEWTPINLWDNENSNILTIDGDDHTIFNMNIDGVSALGFIGKSARDITIQDLTFDEAIVVASGSQAGVIFGQQYGDVTLTNVKVTNSSVKSTSSSGIRLGGMVGQSFLHDGATLRITDCTVDNVNVTGYINVAGLVGSLMGYTDNTDQWTLTGNTVKDCTFTLTRPYDKTDYGYGSQLASAFAVEASSYPHTYATSNDYFTSMSNTQERNTVILQINDAKDMVYFANSVNHANKINTYADWTVKLMANIDLADQTWTSISNFAGTFDGQGYTISNLKDAALFNTISGEVKNLNLKGVTFEGTSYTSFANTVSGKVTNCNVLDINAKVTGYSRGSSFIGSVTDGAVVDNCKVSNVTLTWDDTVTDCGDGMNGAIGNVNTGATVQNCEFTNIKIITYAKTKRVGGVFGSISGNVLNCTVNGVNLIVVDQDGKAAYITGHGGGFASDVSTGAVVKDCIIKNVDITADYAQNGGGIFGKAYGATLKNITVDGLKMTIGTMKFTNGAYTNVAGFISQVDTRANEPRLTIENCHITALDMTLASVSTGESPAAGFISSLCGGADIKECSVSGKIDGTNAPLGIGGFVGDAGLYSNIEFNIKDCVADVTITGNDNIFVGGFVGYAGSYQRNVTITLNFINCEAKGNAGNFYGDIATGTTETSTFTDCKVDGVAF